MANNSIFSTDNVLKLDNTLSEEDFKNIVLIKLQEILRKVFPDNREKQRIKISSDTFTFACPFCRDSATVSTKKRGAFIFKKGRFYNCYKCQNCHLFMSISNFFKKFGENLPLNAVEYLSNNKPITYDSSTLNDSGFSDVSESLFDALKMDSFAVSKDFLVSSFGLYYVVPNSRPAQYLQKRYINRFDNFLYDNSSDSIIILNTIKDKVISFQIRCIKENFKGQKYMTVSLKDIHSKLLKDNIDVPERLNEFSMLYNLYNINPKRPILATEGPIDSLFLPNCIATLGAGKSVNIGLPLWYVFDSDDTGRKESIKKLEKGCHVFLWERLKSEFNLPNKKKWDINDFIIWCFQSGKDIPRYWSSYFTNDSLDIMDI